MTFSSTSRAPNANDQASVYWREAPRLRLKTAAEVSGLSVSSLYNLANDGKLIFRRLAGRTLVDTASLIALIDSDEPWTPSKRGEAARLKRSKEAASRWRA
jgi:hypothetical protein